MSADPLTSDDWWAHVEEKRALADYALLQKLGRQVQEACGFAMEFALKACIMKHRRLNGWPDRANDPDLYDHDLKKLMRLAGIDRSMIPVEVEASFRLALNWRRDFSYAKKPPRRHVAAQIHEATFGPQGAIQWLRGLS